jgi:hypothetical protein
MSRYRWMMSLLTLAALLLRYFNIDSAVVALTLFCERTTDMIRLLLCGRSTLLGIVVMFHSYDYISLFVPFFDIPMSVGSLFQRIASIYDRFYLFRLNQLFEEN